MDIKDVEFTERQLRIFFKRSPKMGTTEQVQ